MFCGDLSFCLNKKLTKNRIVQIAGAYGGLEAREKLACFREMKGQFAMVPRVGTAWTGWKAKQGSSPLHS